MSLFKKILKSKTFLSITTISFVTFLFSLSTFSANQLSTQHALNDKSTRDVSLAEPTVVSKTFDIATLGGDLYDYKDSFILSDYNLINAQNSKLQVINNKANPKIDWDANGKVGDFSLDIDLTAAVSVGSSTFQINSIGPWSNLSTSTNDPNQKDNFFVFKSVSGSADDTGSYKDKVNSSSPGFLSYSQSQYYSPPYINDAKDYVSNQSDGPGAYKFYQYKRGINSDFRIEFDEPNPVVLSFGIKVNNVVPNTNNASKRNWMPFIRMNLDSDYDLKNAIWNNDKSGNWNPSSKSYGMYSVKYDNNNSLFTSFSGIFDAIPDGLTTKYASISSVYGGLNGKPTRLFARYKPSNNTTVSNFNVKFSPDDNKLPSKFLESIASNNTFFNPSNFSISAQYALPSTFYGSKLKVTADDNLGTLSYEFIPGIGAKVMQSSYAPSDFSIYDVGAPNTNLVKKTQSGWKRIKDTYIKSSYQLSTNDDLYINALYAQFATLDKNLDDLKEIVRKQIIFGNVPNNFTNNNIIIENIDFSNKGGFITFDLFLDNYFLDQELHTDKKLFGNIKITGFKQINGATQIVNPIINDPTLNQNIITSWINDPNIVNTIENMIYSNNCISNVPDGANMILTKSDFTTDSHPPKVTIPIYFNQIFVPRPDHDDFLVQDAVGENYLGVGNISIIGFKEIWPTTINIPPSDLDNAQKIYASQYTENDAIDMVFKNVSHAPEGFTQQNIIINNFLKDNNAGIVSFEVKLNKYYDNNLYLQNDSTNFTPIFVKITNFIKVPGPTTFISPYANPKWNTISPSNFTDTNIMDVLREKCFSNLLKDSNITLTNVVRDNTKGTISVDGSVDKYFDINYNYVDSNIPGNKPLQFNILLINFYKTSETSIDTNTLNVTLPSISPTDVQDKVLKTKLKSIIKNSPRDLSINNILFQTSNGKTSYEPDNTKGIVKVNLGLNLWYDREGNIKTTFRDFGQFIFTGMKITTQTILPITGWEDFGVGYVASDVANNRFELITLIDSGIQGDKPDQWNPENDIIICDQYGNQTNNIVFNNQEGTIDVYVKLRRFYDKKGILQTQWVGDPAHITIGGFQKILPTDVIKKYDIPNMQNTLATNYSDIPSIINLLDEYSKDIFISLPSNFDFSTDIIIDFNKELKPNPNNLDGQIIIDYKITHYYNKQGILVSNDIKNPLTGTLILSGFKQVQETTINKVVEIPGVNDVIASELKKSDVLQLVEKNKNVIFNSQPDNGVKIRDINITNNQMNLTGKLEIEIIYSNYYDAKGNLINTPKPANHILLTGFKMVKKTTFNTKINLAEKSPLYPNQLTPTLLTNLLSESNVLPLFLKNYPDNFSARDIIEVTINSFNNIKGTVTIDVKIINYYNNVGDIELVNPLSIKNLVITNFSSNNPTVFNNEIKIPPENNLSIAVASQVDINDIKKFLYNNLEQIASNLPIDFNENNLRNVRIINHDNLLGQLDVEISITNYYDESGVLQLAKLHKWNVKIIGFAKVTPTTVNTDIYLDDVSTLKASNIDNIGLINIIMRNKSLIFNSLPDNFGSQNIIVKSLKPNDSSGYIDASISITSYFGQNGDVENASNPLNATIRFYNFAKVVVTTVAEEYHFENVSSYVASEFSVNKLKDLIFFNLSGIYSSLPSDFSYNDIREVNIISPNNANGSLSVSISITNFFNPTNGLVDKINLLTSNVLFTGFKTITPTTAVQKYELKVSSNVTPSELDDDDIKQYISQSYDEIFIPLPSNFTERNILSTKIVRANNLTGEINVNVTLNLYFDEYSSISTSDKIFSLTLTGFTKVKKTVFIESVHLDNVNNISAYSLSAQDIVELIFRNKDKFIKNPGENFSVSNINLNSVDNIDNSNGILEVSINYTNYYNEEGELILGNSILKKHYISGFSKNSKITTLKNNNLIIKNYSTTLAQSISKNTELVKQMIFENINSILNGVPLDISYDDIFVNNIDFNNLTGEITLNLLLSKYYNKYSVLVDDKNNKKSFKIKISGFKKVSETTQKTTNLNVENFDNILASENTNIIQLKNYIWSKKDVIFSSLPSNMNINDLIVEISEIDNLEGSLTVYIKLNKWFSSTGELQTISSKEFVLTLSGFKKVIKTTVNENVDISFPNNINSSAYYADTVTTDDIKKIIVYNKSQFFNNIPSDFNVLNIQTVQIVSRNNLNGSVKIKFSFFNFFDKFGNVEKNQNFYTENVITLNGFLKISPTQSLKTISVASNCSNNLASIYRDELFNELNNVISSKKQEIFNGTLPFDAKVSLTSINSINNLDGIANVTITTDKYYDKNAKLVNEIKNYNIKLVGFKNIVNSSTISGQHFSIKNSNLNIDINDFDEIYSNYFKNIIPSNINSSPAAFNTILKEAISDVTVQNGLSNNIYPNIEISNINYVPNSSNDLDGSFNVTADISNYWDNITGEFNTTPLLLTIKISGLKTLLSSNNSSSKIIILVLIILLSITICLIISLLIAKAPKIFRKKI